MSSINCRKRSPGWTRRTFGELTKVLNHLKLLEAERIYILREAVSAFENLVMLYSVGKDSTVMLLGAAR